MSYTPEERRERNREATKRYRAAHPDRVRAARRAKRVAMGKHGHTTTPRPILDRFLDKLICLDDEQGGCWQWQGTIAANGYSAIYLDRDRHGPKIRDFGHRVSYRLFVGPIPAGLHIDHLCRNRACVNPDHLEPVTVRENQIRGTHGLKTHCPQGHPYDDRNTYRNSKGHRHCRACARDRQRRRKAAECL